MRTSGLSAKLCTASKKVMFDSRATARRQGKLYGQKHGKKYRVYHCADCMSFHLTTQRRV